MLDQPFNFSAGPGALARTVLRQAQEAIAGVPEMGGLSVLGISHRSDWFRAVVDECEANLRALLAVPDDYHVLFLQGGASLQFAMIPLAMLHGGVADYLVGGYWSTKAIQDARQLGRVRVAWDGGPGYRSLPAPEAIDCAPDAAYLHYVTNETVEGLQFPFTPGLPQVPRVADMSSDFLSRPLTVSEYALIYAHAQKNLGPAGVTLVLIRDDVVRAAPRQVPMLDYATQVQHRSLYNTPPAFAIYVVLLVTRWLRDEIGGVAAMAAINQAKAARLYAALDAWPEFYRAHADPAVRSEMNASFRLADPQLQASFLTEARAAGLYGLEGHRSLGGLRASLYNAVSMEAVETLAGFLEDFAQRHA